VWLVLCSPDDDAAQWAAPGLTRRGLTPLVAVSPDAIVCSRDLVHEITNGRARTTFTLPDGRVIDSRQVRGALNRIMTLPLNHIAGAVAGDRDYAAYELHAVVLSLLFGLGDRVLNRPTPQGLAGRQRSVPEWIAFAARAGFRTADCHEDDREGLRISPVPRGRCLRAIVLDDTVHSVSASLSMPPPASAISADSAFAASAIALARLAETRLLGIDAIESPAGCWWFAGASTMPDLRLGGESLLDALAEALTA
jgi:hypothetical protein